MKTTIRVLFRLLVCLGIIWALATIESFTTQAILLLVAVLWGVYGVQVWEERHRDDR
jgi:hypothetical protein